MLIITKAVEARAKEVQMQPTRLQDLALGKRTPFMLASLGVFNSWAETQECKKDVMPPDAAFFVLPFMKCEINQEMCSRKDRYL